MCSSANPTEEELQQSQAAFTQTLQSSFSQAFAQNQQILGNLSQTLQKAIANPQGFTPQEMAALRTTATDNVASGVANADKAAGNYGASHGGADLGSGVQAQIAGEAQQSGIAANSSAQNNITVANAQQQQQNYWNAIGGLTNVGAAYNPTSYAGAETGSANATTSASNAVSAEQEQSWQNAFGVVKGVAGLAGAALTGGASLAASGALSSIGGSGGSGGSTAPTQGEF